MAPKLVMIDDNIEVQAYVSRKLEANGNYYKSFSDASVDPDANTGPSAYAATLYDHRDEACNHTHGTMNWSANTCLLEMSGAAKGATYFVKNSLCVDDVLLCITDCDPAFKRLSKISKTKASRQHWTEHYDNVLTEFNLLANHTRFVVFGRVDRSHPKLESVDKEAHRLRVLAADNV